MTRQVWGKLNTPEKLKLYDFSLNIPCHGDSVQEAWQTIIENPEFFQLFEKSTFEDLVSCGQLEYEEVADDDPRTA